MESPSKDMKKQKTRKETKATLAKKMMHKGIKMNTRILFDDDGEVRNFCHRFIRHARMIKNLVKYRTRNFLWKDWTIKRSNFYFKGPIIISCRGGNGRHLEGSTKILRRTKNGCIYLVSMKTVWF